MRGVCSARRLGVVLFCAAAAATASIGGASATPPPAAPAHGVPAGAQPVQSQWTRTSRTYRSGGTNVTVAYAGPVNYRDGSGTWQPVDDTLVPSSAPGYAYENRADEYKVRLPSDISAAPVEVDHRGSSVGFQLRGAHAPGTATGAKERFAGALPHTDVAYDATSQGVRETLTLASPDAPQSFTYDLHLDHGATAVQAGPRAVVLLDAHGERIAYFVAPSMHDAAGATSSSIGLALSGDTVTVTPDAAWLGSDSRQWPVTVDPDLLTLNGANQDTYIASGSPDTFFAGGPLLEVGLDGSQTLRGLLNFNPDNYLPTGVTVDSAQLALNLESETTATAVPVSVYNATAPWREATWKQFDWNYQTRQPLLWTTPGGDVDTSLASTVAGVGGQTGVTYTWDVTQLLQRELDGAPDGFVLEQQGESLANILGFTSSYSTSGNPLPTLTITWEPQSTSGPQANLNWTSIDFGSAPVGTTTPTQDVYVTNTGSASLSVSGLTITGNNPGDFSVASNHCTGSTIAPGGSCTITLTARPQATGNRSATLQIADNAANSPQSVALFVTGLAGTATGAGAVGLSPTSLDFGSVKVGKASAAKTVSVTNTGSGTLTISGVSRGGANPNDFAVSSNTCKAGLKLAPGASCTVGVTAKPRVKGTRTATLQITDNAANSPQSVPLSVVGY